jgi:hypothetical protein
MHASKGIRDVGDASIMSHFKVIVIIKLKAVETVGGEWSESEILIIVYFLGNVEKARPDI